MSSLRTLAYAADGAADEEAGAEDAGGFVGLLSSHKGREIGEGLRGFYGISDAFRAEQLVVRSRNISQIRYISRWLKDAYTSSLRPHTPVA